MTNPDRDNFNAGGLPDRIDLRDYEWKEVAFSTQPFDWSKPYDIEKVLASKLNVSSFKIPVKDQGDSSSCGGQAWAYLSQILEALFTGSFEERSAKYTYAQTYVPTGGSRGRDNAKIFIEQGVAREASLTSYESLQPPTEAFMQRSQDISVGVRADALLSRSLSYAQTGTKIDDVAQAIKANNGVIIGITGSNNGSWRTPFPKPPKSTDTNLWRHWVYAGKAKLINGKKYIGILNSWGEDVGNDGWQWISEDYFKTFINIYSETAVWSGWTHVFNGNPIPPAFHHVFNVDIVFGSTEQEVIQLQTALQIEGQFPATIPITGFFGNITLQAVQKFQVKYGIATATTSGFGRVGPKTRAKLNELFGN